VNRSLIDQIRREVREEIRTAAMLDVPEPIPPAKSTESEQIVCAALILRDVTPDELAPLARDDFFGRLHGAIFETVEKLAGAGVRVTGDSVFKRMRSLAIREHELAESILDLVYLNSACHRDDVCAHAWYLVELSRARSLSRVLAEIDAQLRTGGPPTHFGGPRVVPYFDALKRLTNEANRRAKEMRALRRARAK
jgi:replicative DNA helicase